MSIIPIVQISAVPSRGYHPDRSDLI